MLEPTIVTQANERTAAPAPGPTVSIIVPARNEEASIARCLESLTTQGGIEYEIIVVDDHSTDETHRIAQTFAAVTVLRAPALPHRWTGKCHACWAGATYARGRWLLFTDADTVHAPGSLSRAVETAIRHEAALLSYSPEQELQGLWQRAVMPLIFAELAATYRPRDVSDAHQAAAAANGQYLLISREAYDAIGGHAAVASSVLEDVEIARLVKAGGRRILFRYGGGEVRTRMYRGVQDMIDGWTKNLFLLFPQPEQLARRLIVEFFTLAGAAVAILVSLVISSVWLLVIAMVAAFLAASRLFRRVARAHFDLLSTAISPVGLPVFAYLLRRSRIHHVKGMSHGRGAHMIRDRNRSARRP